MIANYEEHGFEVSAEQIPHTCTACPFWLVDTQTAETGGCFITGQEVQLDGRQDEGRMDECPIVQRREWHDVKCELPEPNVWVLLSFENDKTTAIGQRIVETDGRDNFYLDDEEVGYIPCESLNMPVNAWMPLPKPYRREEQDHETD